MSELNEDKVNAVLTTREHLELMLFAFFLIGLFTGMLIMLFAAEVLFS